MIDPLMPIKAVRIQFDQLGYLNLLTTLQVEYSQALGLQASPKGMPRRASTLF